MIPKNINLLTMYCVPLDDKFVNVEPWVTLVLHILKDSALSGCLSSAALSEKSENSIDLVLLRT